MKPEAQRIAIAKACGWNFHNRHPIYGEQSVKSWYYRDTDTTVSHKSSLPDYLNDLNAMAEAEKLLTNDQQDAYFCMLARSPDGKSYLGARAFSATAAQRAEVFLKTLNLWNE